MSRNSYLCSYNILVHKGLNQGDDMAVETRAGSVKAWMQGIRVFSLTASLIPVLVGGALAMGFEGAVLWWLFPLVLLCSFLFQAGTNTVGDYFDYKYEVDKDYTYGSSRVIVDGLLEAKSLHLAGLIMFAAGAAIGVVFIAVHGPAIFAIGGIGLLGGYFYAAKPIALKHRALGDVSVFILMGPLMVIGSYLVLTGSFALEALLVSLPVGCLVAAILYANNLRDIKHDAEAHVKTLAGILGYSRGKVIYYSLVFGAYAIVFGLAAFGVLTWWGLLTFVSIPLAVKNVMAIAGNADGSSEKIAGLDIETAKLHLAFGVLLSVSIVIGNLV